jgi:hypothetical protein
LRFQKTEFTRQTRNFIYRISLEAFKRASGSCTPWPSRRGGLLSNEVDSQFHDIGCHYHAGKILADAAYSMARVVATATRSSQIEKEEDHENVVR